MRIASQQLLRLPVYTELGEHIGRVDGFELDVDSHLVVAYLVVSATGPSAIVAALFTGASPLRVARTQVVSISAERMVVKDAVLRSSEITSNKEGLVESNEQATTAL